VACTLCLVVCPSNAIQAIVADEGSDHEKYPVAFTIDLQRCIFCGFCQEACPKGAIKLNSLYELAQYDKKLLILNIEGATQSKSQLRLGDWL
jgi:NADH-quinone oxidoreductase subunit I